MLDSSLTRIRAAAARLAGDQISRSWSTVFGGTVARLALGLVASVLTARALGPAALGTYAGLGVVAGVGGALADLGLSVAAVRRVAAAWPSDQPLARQRGQAFLLLRAALALALTLLALPLAPLLAPLLPGRPAAGLVLLALLGVVATGVSGALSALLQATGAFRRLSVVLIANSALTSLLAAGLAAARALDLYAAVAVLGIGTTLASAALAWCLLPPALRAPAPVSGLRGEARELFAFGGWAWLASGLGLLAGSLDLLLVGRWLPPADVGLYALASSLAGKAEVVNQSLHAVLLPAASRLAGAEERRAYVRRSLERSAALCLLLLPALPLAGPLIELFYGPAFGAAAGPFRALLGIAALDLLAAPLLMLVYAVGRPRLLAAAEAASVAATVGSAPLLVPALGLWGAALTRLCARAAGVGLTLAALRAGRPAPAGAPSPES